MNSITHFNEPAWRGAGKTVKADTALEAIEQAKLDWEVGKQALSRFNDFGNYVAMPEAVALVRRDTDAVLGVVGPDYGLVQNKEAFGFFDRVVEDGGATYVGAGSFGGGKRVWVQAKWDGDVEIVRGDTVQKFLLLSNGHDGHNALRVFITPVRVFCTNTLNSALRGAGRSGVTVEHSGDMTVKLRQAEQTLGVVRRYYDDFTRVSRQTTEIQVNRARLTALLDSVVPLPKDKEPSEKAKAVRTTIVRLFEEGKGNQHVGVRGTGWAFVNAVAEYADFYRASTGKTDEARATNRLDSIWFGSGAQLKARAWDTVLAAA